MNKNEKVILLIGILVITLSVFLFLLKIENKTNAQYLYGAFIVFAEIVLFSGLIKIASYSQKVEKIIFYVGNTFVLFFYSLVSIIVSLLYLFHQEWKTSSFWMLQITFLITLLIFVALFSFVAQVKNKEESN